ncbi:MAG: peptidoglycan DD-metalloendopeptidase family protein, partial [Chthoniobacterales bacterium]
QIFVREGQQLKRGQLLGTIGTNRGMYTAHLHFEIRKNLRIGINQGSYRKDLSNYYKPYDFVIGKRQLSGGNRRVNVPINTFRLAARVVDTMGGRGSTVSQSSGRENTPPPAPKKTPTETRKGEYRIYRFE